MFLKHCSVRNVLFLVASLVVIGCAEQTATVTLESSGGAYKIVASTTEIFEGSNTVDYTISREDGLGSVNTSVYKFNVAFTLPEDTSITVEDPTVEIVTTNKIRVTYNFPRVGNWKAVILVHAQYAELSDAFELDFEVKARN